MKKAEKEDKKEIGQEKLEEEEEEETFSTPSEYRERARTHPGYTEEESGKETKRRGRPRKELTGTRSIEEFFTSKRKINFSPEEKERELKKRCEIEKSTDKKEKVNSEVKKEGLGIKEIIEIIGGKKEEKMNEEWMNTLKEEIKKSREDTNKRWDLVEKKMKDLEDYIKEKERSREEREKKREEKDRLEKEEKQKWIEKWEETSKRTINIEERLKKLEENGQEEGNKTKEISKEEEEEERNACKKREERRWEEWSREKIRNNVIISGLKINGRIEKEEVEKWVKEWLRG